MEWNEKARISCQFRFKCPQLWDRLQPTKTGGRAALSGMRPGRAPRIDARRHFRRHIDEGRCIAVPVMRGDNQANPDMPIYAVGMAMPPYGTE